MEGYYFIHYGLCRAKLDAICGFAESYTSDRQKPCNRIITAKAAVIFLLQKRPPLVTS